MLYANFTKGRWLSQFPLKSMFQALRRSWNVLIVRSAWPSGWGWKAVLNFTLVPNPSWNDLQNLDVNCEHLSNMMDNVIPWWIHNLIYEYPYIILLRVSRLDEIKCADSVILSINTHIELYCFWFKDRPTTKSMLMSSHFKQGMWISWSKLPGFWCSAFTCWQFGHIATNFAMFIFEPSHHNIP